MRLKILLPYDVFTEQKSVSRIVAETHEGSLGILPHRLDCVVALAPGILVYEVQTTGEVYVAIDEGILVKTGADVAVSVRNAIGGTDLQLLRTSVEQEFVNVSDEEQRLRTATSKMESSLVSQLAAFNHE